MSRPLRIEFPNALYHVTSRGNERRDIFRSDEDRLAFLTFLGQAAIRFGWSVTAYVLMTNHFHLVIQTREANLSRGMQWLNAKYAGAFNRRYKRSGHLFQGRFHAFLVEKESYFASVLRYVVLNPVRAKMVARPEDYRWSSYRATAGLEQALGWLDLNSVYLSFGVDEARAQAEYRSFVHAAIDSDELLWDRVTNAIYLGSEQWTRTMRRVVESKPRATDHTVIERAVGRPNMHSIMTAVSRIGRTSRDVLRSVKGGSLRLLVAWLGWHEGLITLRTIAASLRLRSEGYVSTLIRDCERRLTEDAVLLSIMGSALASLRA